MRTMLVPCNQSGGDHLALDAVAQLAHFLLALGATDFASIDARILLGNARGQVDLPLDAKGFQRLEVVAVDAVASSRRVCG